MDNCKHENAYAEGHQVNYNTERGLDDQVYCPDCDLHFLYPEPWTAK